MKSERQDITVEAEVREKKGFEDGGRTQETRNAGGLWRQQGRDSPWILQKEHGPARTLILGPLPSRAVRECIS